MAVIRQIREAWTPLRITALPLVADDDWRGNNDIEGMKAAGLFVIVPKADARGELQLSVEYLDAAGELVIPANNSRLTLELLELSKIPALAGVNPVAKTIVMKAGDDITLQGEQFVGGIVGKYRADVGFRFVSTQSEPAGATQMVVSARYA